MTKRQWIILLVSASTDMVITIGTALTTAMVAGEMVKMPSGAVIAVACIGGVIALARTIQQHLKKIEEEPKP